MHQDLQTGCQDSTLLLTMVGNHDTTRLAATIPSLALRKNAIAYSFISDGIPVLYQGDEQSFAGATDDPDNREALWTSGFDKSAPLYQIVRKLNKLRSWVGRHDTSYWIPKTTIFWSDPHTMALRRGSNGIFVVAILTNGGGNLTMREVNVQRSGYVAGTILIDIIACEEVAVGKDGALRVTMADGNPKVLLPIEHLGWSGICDSWLPNTSTSNYSRMSMR